MDVPRVVPVCPPGPASALARHFRINGWAWSEDLLLEVVGELSQEDVCDVTALRCLDLRDVEHAESWPPEVQEFMQTMVRTYAFA